MELSPPVPPERSDQRLTLFMSGHHKGFHLLNSNLLEEAESHLVAYPNLTPVTFALTVGSITIPASTPFLWIEPPFC